MCRSDPTWCKSHPRSEVGGRPLAPRSLRNLTRSGRYTVTTVSSNSIITVPLSRSILRSSSFRRVGGYLSVWSDAGAPFFAKASDRRFAECRGFDFNRVRWGLRGVIVCRGIRRRYRVGGRYPRAAAFLHDLNIDGITRSYLIYLCSRDMFRNEGLTELPR